MENRIKSGGGGLSQAVALDKSIKEEYGETCYNQLNSKINLVLNLKGIRYKDPQFWEHYCIEMQNAIANNSYPDIMALSKKPS